jgi:hypothetical protein
MKTPMEYLRIHQEKGAIGYILAWAMGVTCFHTGHRVSAAWLPLAKKTLEERLAPNLQRQSSFRER